MTRVQFPVAEYLFLLFLFKVTSNCLIIDKILLSRYKWSGRVAQWIRRRSAEPKIVGSSPTVVIILFMFGSQSVHMQARQYVLTSSGCSHSSVGQSVGLINLRSAVQARVGAYFENRKYLGKVAFSLLKSNFGSGALAQLVARRSHNPKVVSSILTGPIFWSPERIPLI